MEEYGDASEGKQEWVPYVSGAAVLGASGRQVRVWGRVQTSGDQLRLVAADGTELPLRLRGTLDTPPAGWLEVTGVVEGRIFLADTLLSFPTEMCAELDLSAHHALTHLLTAIDDPWNLGED